MPGITLPHTFHDGVGEQASGVQVMDNLNALKTPLERTAWGAVNAAAAIERAGSGDWTVAKTGTGQYELKWSPERAAIPTVAANCNAATYIFANVVTVSKTAATISLFNSTTGAAVDTQFSFIAMGG